MNPEGTDTEPEVSDVELRFNAGRFEELLGKVLVLLEVVAIIMGVFFLWWGLFLTVRNFRSPDVTVLNNIALLVAAVVLLGGGVYIHSLWE